MSDRLPGRLRRVVDQVLRSAGLRGSEAREVRADLERHFEDGLAAGRSEEELLERFGDPAVAARALAGGLPRSARGRRLAPRATVQDVLRDLLTDARHAVRSMLSRPALAVTIILVLALGIGANTVVFTVVSELVLRPLPVDHPEALVDVWPDVPGGNSFLGFSWEDYTAYRDGSSTLESLAAFAGTRLTHGDGAQGQEVVAQLVASEYFPMLGIDAISGTVTFADDASFGTEPVAVLSHAWWRDALGAEPGVIGRTLRLDGTTVTVIGVAPPGFTGHFLGFPVDLWLPLAVAPSFLPAFDPADPSSKPFEMIGRLSPGASPSAASQELNAIARRLEARFPEMNRGHRVGVTRTTGVDHSLRAGVDTFVAILTVVATLVLVIACLNVGSMLLVRALSRERDLAIRLAMGAGNGRLVRQMLTEATVLVVVGAGAGTLLARYLNGWLAGLVRRLTGGLGPELALDWRALALTGAAAFAAALLAGLAPAIHVVRGDPASALRGRSGARGAAGRLRSGLVVAQVAVSVVLVATTGLFVRSLVAGTRADPGFDADRVASFTLDLRGLDLPPGVHAQRQRELLEALIVQPGVEGAALSDAPVVGVARSPLRIQVPGVQPPAGESGWVVDAHTVGAGYLDVLGVQLRSGRLFAEPDDRSGPSVAVVNRAFADRFWPGQDAVGRTLVVGSQQIRVVGVVENARYLVQDDTPDPLIYRSVAGGSLGRVRVTIRAAEPEAMAAAVQRVVEGVVPGHDRVILVPAARTLGEALLPQRLGAMLVGGMGLGALFLAGVGLYGLIQFTVSRSMHELGVRLALGGSRRDLLRVVLGKGFLLVAMGTGIGLLLAIPAGWAVTGFLGGVSATDPLALSAVVLVFTAVAVAASWLPARRAAGVDPAEALRGD